jgi:osmotically-inducible protein OsmY
MKSDIQLKKDVIDELDWDPSVDATQIGVTVKDGIVTLTGHLDSYAQKIAAERAVGRVAGVKAIAVELDVRLAAAHKRTDSEIASAIESALKWHVLVPAERVKVKVEKGWVTLTGEVDWEYQRGSIEKAVRPLTGVIGVTDLITLKPQVTPKDVSKRISEALERHAEREAKRIEVAVDGSTVTLRGSADSWSDRAAIQGAAWSAPGVHKVINEVRVGL